jgi:transposase
VSPADLDLPSDPDELRAFAEAMKERLSASEQALADERKAHDATRDELGAARNAIKLTTLQIEKLKAQLAKLRRMKFGQSSERMTQLADQLELTLEDLEARQAHAECVVRGQVDQDETEEPKPRRKPKRAPLPDHLPRDVITHPAPGADRCAACGGKASVLGEDVTEVLEYVPASFRVVRHVRPKVACKCCDTIAQAPAPALPIPRGRAGPGLLAHIIVAKFADHLPLYRQSQIYAREGVELPRSTMADWLGQVYLRDNRRWSPSDKPAALFRYSPDRKGERPREHLAAFAGFLQADAYAGFNALYDSGREPGPITPVACWAHARRKLHDVLVADRGSAARKGLAMIAQLYEIERLVGGEPPMERLRQRSASQLIALDFFAWADSVLGQASARSPLAEALRYAVKLKSALLAYTQDGRLEIDNNLAENALRGIAVGRKNWLFAGADCGGERAAAMYSLLETAKLNDVNPQVWLTDVLDRIGKGHPINRIDELLPWAWKAIQSSDKDVV